MRVMCHPKDLAENQVGRKWFRRAHLANLAALTLLLFSSTLTTTSTLAAAVKVADQCPVYLLKKLAFKTKANTDLPKAGELIHVGLLQAIS